jgi:hypothetical protein
MIWKRKGSVSIDLRRPREESGGFGGAGRLVFFVAIAGLAIVAGTALVLEVLGTVRPSVFSVKEAQIVRAMDCAGVGPGEDCPVEVYWSVEAVRQPSDVRVEDIILSINGRSAESLDSSGEEREAFLNSLAEARSLSLVVKRSRQPDPGRASEFRWLGGARGTGISYSRTSDSDTLEAGETLPDVLARLAPDGDSLTAAEVAEIADVVLDYEGLPPIGSGAVIRVYRYIENPLTPSPDAAVNEVTLSFADGEDVRLIRGDDGWGPPVVELPVEIGLRRTPWREAMTAIAYRLGILFVLLEGFLALRAKSRDVALPRFVLLCLLFAVPAPLFLMGSWSRVVEPALAVVGVAFALPMLLVGVGVTLAVALAYVFLGSFLRLLHVFPSDEPELAGRFPVPLLIPGIAVIATGVWAVPLYPVMWGPPVRFTLLRYSAALVTLLLIAATLLFIIRIIRLAKAQAGLERDLEGSGKARIALFGIKYGFLMLALALVLSMMPRGYTTAMPWTVTLDNSLTLIRDLLIPIGLIAPFVGFFIAIVGRGLWEVDLIVKRTTVYSALTFLFVIAYLFLDVSVENLVPAGLFGVGLLNDLAAAALAGGLVAVSQRWVTGGLSRRFFPESIGFDRAIEEVSEDVATAEPGASPGEYLGERLATALGANPCAVLVRIGEDLFRKVWSAGETTPTALVAAAASTALDTNPSAVVMTDDGPVLAARIGRGEAYPGLLLLGPRPNGRFYTTEERRLLTPLLNQAAMLLRQS